VLVLLPQADLLRVRQLLQIVCLKMIKPTPINSFPHPQSPEEGDHLMTVEVDLKPFQQALRKLGFRRIVNYRSTINPDVQIYSQDFPNERVKVEVQLWGNGQHRASHWHPSTFAPGFTQMDTTPTDFHTVKGMQRAITHERTRYFKLKRNPTVIIRETIKRTMTRAQKKLDQMIGYSNYDPEGPSLTINFSNRYRAEISFADLAHLVRRADEIAAESGQGGIPDLHNWRELK
jgi:hypothetical protein